MALYITGISADGTYFVDQNNNPRLMCGEDIWALVVNGGRWGGTCQTDIDDYLSARGGQGYNTAEVLAYSDPDANMSFVHTDGRDWDGLWPFISTNDPSSGLNNAFWVKRDYLLTSAATYGFTVVMNITGTTTGQTGSLTYGWTDQQWTDYGTNLATRYLGVPNLFWIMGDEYSGGFDTQYSLLVSAIRAAGDNRPLSLQSVEETTSRTHIDTAGDGTPTDWGATNAQYNWCYSYNVSYTPIEVGKTETPAIPTIWGDGGYLTSDSGTELDTERNQLWWCLSSGGSGFSTGDNNIYPWASTSYADITITTFYTVQMPALIGAFSSLNNWQHLQPDTGSLLVTSGRGTHRATTNTGGPYYAPPPIDAYVTASVTPDGSLAVIYCAVAFAITINQAKLTPGYGAYWVDPANGTKTSTTAGASYNSGPLGHNSSGTGASNNDWVLVLAAPPYATWQVP